MRWRFLDGAGRAVALCGRWTPRPCPRRGAEACSVGLTEQAVAELIAEGVGIVFNTPNDQSRPGYLKMGWSVVGRLPLTVRTAICARHPSVAPSSRGSGAVVVALQRRARRRRRHSQTVGGRSAAGSPASGGWRTDRTREYLAWRFGLEPLHYRLLLVSGDPAEGGIVFRLRRRGPAVEAAVVEQLVPDGRSPGDSSDGCWTRPVRTTPRACTRPARGSAACPTARAGTHRRPWPDSHPCSQDGRSRSAMSSSSDRVGVYDRPQSPARDQPLRRRAGSSPRSPRARARRTPSTRTPRRWPGRVRCACQRQIGPPTTRSRRRPAPTRPVSAATCISSECAARVSGSMPPWGWRWRTTAAHVRTAAAPA